MSTALMTVPITDAGYLKAFAPAQLYASATLSLKSHGYGFGDESQRKAGKVAGFAYLITFASVVYVNFGIHDRLLVANRFEPS